MTAVRTALIVTLAMLGACGCASRDGSPAGAAPPVRQPDPPPVSRAPDATPQQRSQLRTELASGYYERGQMSVALDELAEAVRLDPTNGRAYGVYGLVYAMLGETAKAEDNFQRAIALAPQDSDVRHNWGWYLCTHNKAREALGEFEAALRNPLYRTPEIALVNAGRCASSLGELKAAENYFRRALATAPGDGNASYGLALIAYKAAHYQEARDWMKGALARSNPPPETLYLGMCIERNLGDRQSELSYVSQLRNRYPDSAEARAIAAGTCE